MNADILHVWVYKSAINFNNIKNPYIYNQNIHLR